MASQIKNLYLKRIWALQRKGHPRLSILLGKVNGTKPGPKKRPLRMVPYQMERPRNGTTLLVNHLGTIIMIWEAFLCEKTIGKLLGYGKKDLKNGGVCGDWPSGIQDKGETWKKIKTITEASP